MKKLPLLLHIFSPFDDEEARVEPVAGEEGAPGGAAGLCDLALVVGEDVVLAAGVDVDHAVVSAASRLMAMTEHSRCQPG